MADPNKLSPQQIEEQIESSVAWFELDASGSTEPYADGTLPSSRISRMIVGNPELLEAFRTEARRRLTGNQ